VKAQHIRTVGYVGFMSGYSLLHHHAPVGFMPGYSLLHHHAPVGFMPGYSLLHDHAPVWFHARLLIIASSRTGVVSCQVTRYMNRYHHYGVSRCYNWGADGLTDDVVVARAVKSIGGLTDLQMTSLWPGL